MAKSGRDSLNRLKIAHDLVIEADCAGERKDLGAFIEGRDFPSPLAKQGRKVAPTGPKPDDGNVVCADAALR